MSRNQWTELIFDGVNCFKDAKNRRKTAHRLAREEKYIQLKPKFKWMWWKTMTVNFNDTLMCINILFHFISKRWFESSWNTHFGVKWKPKRAEFKLQSRVELLFNGAIWPEFTIYIITYRVLFTAQSKEVTFKWSDWISLTLWEVQFHHIHSLHPFHIFTYPVNFAYRKSISSFIDWNLIASFSRSKNEKKTLRRTIQLLSFAPFYYLFFVLFCFVFV